MKIIYSTVSLIILLLICLYGFGYKISINSETTRIYKLEGGYRSWGVNYSWGHQYNPEKGKWVNLWKKPTFFHNDIRKIIEANQ